jgi:hypothetical protein
MAYGGAFVVSKFRDPKRPPLWDTADLKDAKALLDDPPGRAYQPTERGQLVSPVLARSGGSISTTSCGSGSR